MTVVILTIDGQEVTVPSGTTILEAARRLDQNIPVICYHDATTANGLCRMCVVEIEGMRLLQAACVTLCEQGMKVYTHNARVEQSRRTILEMLNASVNLDQAPEIQQLMADYHADPNRFPQAKRREAPLLDDNPFYIRDYSQCVMCWRCVQVCGEDAQYTYALTLRGRGFNTQVSTAFEIRMPESPCVFCGQCVGICPTGALKPKIEYGLEQGWSLEDIWRSTRQKRKGNNNG